MEVFFKILIVVYFLILWIADHIKNDKTSEILKNIAVIIAVFIIITAVIIIK